MRLNKETKPNQRWPCWSQGPFGIKSLVNLILHLAWIPDIPAQKKQEVPVQLSCKENGRTGFGIVNKKEVELMRELTSDGEFWWHNA